MTSYLQANLKIETEFLDQGSWPGYNILDVVQYNYIEIHMQKKNKNSFSFRLDVRSYATKKLSVRKLVATSIGRPVKRNKESVNLLFHKQRIKV